jgi:flagellar protein FliO/FliZ
MFETLFGMPLAARFFIAFVVVLALIAVAAWAVRRFGSSRLGGGSMRGRQPRIAVIEAANVDARRRLLLIRRDNTEHLLMIGGPTDLVIEPNIVRAPAAREPARAENGARGQDTGWPLQPVAEPPARGRVTEENWIPPEVPARPRAPERFGAPLAQRPSPELAPASSKPEPRPQASAPLDGADHNLAEMASQLEAALRRDASKPAEPPRAPMKVRIDPRIEPRSEPKLDVKPESRPEPKLDVRPEPKVEARAEPPKPLFTPEPKREPKLDLKPEPIAPKPDAKPESASRQDFYDNLEEEMASLLGRPPGKS